MHAGVHQTAQPRCRHCQRGIHIAPGWQVCTVHLWASGRRLYTTWGTRWWRCWLRLCNGSRGTFTLRVRLPVALCNATVGIRDTVRAAHGIVVERAHARGTGCRHIYARVVAWRAHARDHGAHLSTAARGTTDGLCWCRRGDAFPGGVSNACARSLTSAGIRDAITTTHRSVHPCVASDSISSLIWVTEYAKWDIIQRNSTA